MSGTEEPALVDATGRNSTNPKNAPISLPPRSYDIDQLHKGLNPTARAKLSRRDGLIAATLEEGAVDGTLKAQPRAAMPNHRFVDVENKELGITERTQVYVEPGEPEPVPDLDDADDVDGDETDPADAGSKGE